MMNGSSRWSPTNVCVKACPVGMGIGAKASAALPPWALMTELRFTRKAASRSTSNAKWPAKHPRPPTRPWSAARGTCATWTSLHSCPLPKVRAPITSSAFWAGRGRWHWCAEVGERWLQCWLKEGFSGYRMPFVPWSPPWGLLALIWCPQVDWSLWLGQWGACSVWLGSGWRCCLSEVARCRWGCAVPQGHILHAGVLTPACGTASLSRWVGTELRVGDSANGFKDFSGNLQINFLLSLFTFSLPLSFPRASLSRWSCRLQHGNTNHRHPGSCGSVHRFFCSSCADHTENTEKPHGEAQF